jgi:hypothetical protein
MREWSENENIGAGIILATILPDEDPRFQETKSTILERSPNYRAAVFKALGFAGYEYAHMYSDWLTNVALNTLLASDWTALGTRGVRAAISIVSRSSKPVRDIAVRCGVSPNGAEMLDVFICRESSRAGKARQVVSSQSYGSLEAIFYKATFDLSNVDEFTWTALAGSNGILQYIYRVIRLSKTQDISDLKELLDCVSDDVSLCSAFPGDSLSTFLPWDPGFDVNKIAEEWRAISPEHLRHLFEKKKVGLYREFSLSKPETVDKTGWHRLIEEFPELSMHLLGSPDFTKEGKDGYLESPELAHKLAEKCIESPRLLASFPELWGKLISLCPDLEAKVRSSIATACSSPVTDKMFFLGLHAFSLNLPDEARLLPHIVNSLIEYALPGHMLSHSDLQAPSVRTASLRSLVARFVDDPKALETVIDDVELDNRTKAAGVMLYLMHPNTEESPERPEYGERLIELYDAKQGRWYLPAAAVCLERAIARVILQH